MKRTKHRPNGASPLISVLRTLGQPGMVERCRTAVGQLKKHPLLILWLAIQLGIVGYVLWLTEVKGGREHHFYAYMLLVPTFGVLLFPGGQIVLTALWVVSWIARQFGWAPARSVFEGTPFWLAVWGASAWLTYTLWTRALQRIKGSAANDRVRTARTSPASSANTGVSMLHRLWWGLVNVLVGSASVVLTAWITAVSVPLFQRVLVAIALLAGYAFIAALVLSHVWLLVALRYLLSDVRLARRFGVLAVCTVLGDTFVILTFWR